MIRLVCPALTLAAVALSVTPALADTAASSNTIDPLKAAVAQRSAEAGSREAAKVISEGSPDGRAAAGFSSSNVQFTSENGETSFSIAASFDLQSYSGQGSDGYYHVSRTRMSAVGSAPIDGEGKGGKLFAGDSLVSGSKLKLSVTHLSTVVGDGGNSGPQIAAAYRRCVSQNSTLWAQAQSDQNAALGSAGAFAAQLNDKLATKADVNFDKLFDDVAKSGDVGKFVTQACSPNAEGTKLDDAYDLIKTYGDDALTFRRRFLPDNAKLTFWGIDASMGRDDHTYLDRVAFKLPSQPRTSWEVGAYYGMINSDLTFSLRGRVVYGQTYKDNDEAQICRTVSIPAGPECIKGPDGAPLRQRSGLASVEARKLVTVSDRTQIAIAPQVTYRTEDKNVGVEVPIYLVPDKDGKLSGGIKAVYNSKGDEFAVGLFVGVPFSIFYN